MRQDPELRWLVEARNVAEKEGVEFAEYGLHLIVRVHPGGSTTVEGENPSLKIDGLRSGEDPLDQLDQVCRRYLQSLKTLINCLVGL